MPGRSRVSAGSALPKDLLSSIERAGYYPALVADVVESALAGDETVAHLVHQETTFDASSVRRHITVLALTPTRLVVAHADDFSDGEPHEAVATATSETIPIGAVRGVMVTHVVPSPDQYVPGTLGREVTLTLGWGAVSRIDIMPGQCGDPSCDGEHGFEGTMASDDISLRVSADADGDAALAAAITFARVLSSSIGSGTIR
ncbi:MAG TPA: DUF5998 family protein [Candidatus Lustribacter sp.]|nr:DUF5998 family protein [Candidatus Lustribacter sp.]